MPLDKDEQEKLRSLLDTGHMPTADNNAVQKHSHNVVCQFFPENYRVFVGLCGHEPSLRWNEIKAEAINYHGRRCVICSKDAKAAYFIGDYTKVENANVEIDFVIVCHDHKTSLNSRWTGHLKNSAMQKVDPVRRMFVLLQSINELQLDFKDEETNRKLEEQKRSYEKLLNNKNSNAIVTSPTMLAEELGMDLQRLNRRSVFLNLSWKDDEEALSYLDYSRLRLSLTSVQEISYLEYPNLELCVVCNNILTDYNVIDDRFDSYVCAGQHPIWDINQVADGVSKCWQNASGQRRWKDSFPTMSVAKDYMKIAAEAHGENPRHYSAYKCSNCFRYHFGHNTRNKLKER